MTTKKAPKIRQCKFWVIATGAMICCGSWVTRGEARSAMVKRQGRSWKEIEASGYQSVRVLVTPLEKS